MVLESTIICVDTSEYMRNGDFTPNRLQAQHEAVSLICHSKLRSNMENNVGLITLSNNPQVLATMTMDVGKILAKLHQVEPEGFLNFMTGIRIAHLALKHRQGKNHKMRIVIFIGSPLELDEKDLEKQAKRLKKENVNVDIINFGEESENTKKLTSFINILNGKEGQGSHLVTVPPGPLLSEALISSPIIQGEDGQGAVGLTGPGYEFGIDPNEDPELALALRVSMEEQRQRQEEDARKAANEEQNVPASSSCVSSNLNEKSSSLPTNEEALLEKALAISFTRNVDFPKEFNIPDFSSMTEDEQVAYAMRMSLEQTQEDDVLPVPMETDENKEEENKKKENDKEGDKKK